MNNPYRYDLKFTDKELDVGDWLCNYLELNNITFKQFNLDNIYRVQKKHYTDKINRYANIFTFGIIGMILLALCLLPFITVLTWIVFFIGGVFMVVICIFSFMMEARPHAKRH